MASATKFINNLKRGWFNVLVGEYSSVLPAMNDGERAVAQMDGGGRLLVGGKLHREIVVAPVGSVSPAYSIGDHMGGKLTFANALRQPTLSGRLTSIAVNCKTVQTNTLLLALFKADPAATTFTDNAAAAIAAGDFDKLIEIFTLGAPTSKMGTHTSFTLDNINRSIQAAGTSLYGALINAVGTPTLGSTGDLSVALGLEQD
jgi:hypothetical protein